MAKVSGELLDTVDRLLSCPLSHGEHGHQNDDRASPEPVGQQQDPDKRRIAYRQSGTTSFFFFNTVIVSLLLVTPARYNITYYANLPIFPFSRFGNPEPGSCQLSVVNVSFQGLGHPKTWHPFG